MVKNKNAAEKSTAGTGGGPPKADCEAMEWAGTHGTPEAPHTRNVRQLKE